MINNFANHILLRDRFEVLTAVDKMIIVFWDVTACSLLYRY
jgi:hypothetical protein